MVTADAGLGLPLNWPWALGQILLLGALVFLGKMGRGLKSQLCSSVDPSMQGDANWKPGRKDLGCGED